MTLALLALLATTKHGISRDKLAAYLWPERDTEAARHLLKQACYALRRDLQQPDLIAGSTELSLNAAVIGSDVKDFIDALARDDRARAVGLYPGPFLDGFYVAESESFERWVEDERGRLRALACAAIEALATDLTRRGDYRAAAERWRQLAALDPTSAQVVLNLMRALVAARERAQALEVGQRYVEYIRRELDAAPASAVTDLIKEVRAQSGESLPRAPGPVSQTSPAPLPGPGIRARIFKRTAITAIAAVIVLSTIIGGRDLLGPGHGAPVIAVGLIRDDSVSHSPRDAPTVAEMLATNLARVPGLTVLSTARMYELAGGWRDSANASAALGEAAQRAGATQLLQGTLYHRANGRLHLELQRIDLRRGVVQGAYAVEGSDAFAVTDSVTARVSTEMGVRSDTLRIADVTTKSLVAYGLYQDGLRAFYTDPNIANAHRLFAAAEGEDSGFVMAVYYGALVERLLGIPGAVTHFERAARLADRAPDRVRLLVRASWALEVGDPARVALAETLAIRYPREPDGHDLLGSSMLWGGDFQAGIEHFRQVVALDSQSLHHSGPICRACNALAGIVLAYQLADSFPAADRIARAWVKRPSQSVVASGAAWNALATTLEFQAKAAAALEAYHQAAVLAPLFFDESHTHARIALRSGDFAEADRLLEDRLQNGTRDSRGAFLWLRIISLRAQGRLREALIAARQVRELGAVGREPGRGPPFEALSEAIVLFEAGRTREAAALFDSLGATVAVAVPALIARNRCWMFTHEATALAAAGDTDRLAQLADTVEKLGPQSAYGRDRLLYHHIRGLLLAARGQPAQAAAEFRRAIFSLTGGYTRTNLELARALLELRRPHEAVALLQAAFRGPLDASNLYVTHTELHEMLARAFEAAGEPDSARAHYQWVVRAWEKADPRFRMRYEFALRRSGVTPAPAPLPAQR